MTVWKKGFGSMSKVTAGDTGQGPTWSDCVKRANILSKPWILPSECKLLHVESGKLNVLHNKAYSSHHREASSNMLETRQLTMLPWFGGISVIFTP